MEPEWRDIPGFEGFYQASNTGFIRSVRRMKRGRNGFPVWMKGKVLSPSRIGNNYLQVSLSKFGIITPEYVHRLVWFTFKGPIPPDKEINHEDGVKSNCCLDNLTCGTHKENMQHAIANKLSTILDKGENNPASVLNEHSVRRIRALHAEGFSMTSIANLFGCSLQNISLIVNRETWKHI